MEEDDNDEDHDSDDSMGENESAPQEGSQEKNEEDTNRGIIDGKKSNLKVYHEEYIQMKLIKPFPLTYQRGERHVFAAFKGQGTMPSSSAQRLDKGKEKLKGDNKGKGGKKTTQKPQFIDLDSDNEDEEVATRLLLQSKDAKIRESERDFEMA